MHRQLTKEDRRAIDYYLVCSWGFGRIGAVLKRSSGTIRREVLRNRSEDGLYRYGAAHKRAMARRKAAKEVQYKLRHDGVLQARVERRLRKHDSPQQIAGRLRRDGIVLSHETIYRWIYDERPDLVQYLRCQKGQWRRKRGTKQREAARRGLQFRCIESRPAIVEERGRLGDWEGDTVIGQEKTQRIVTYVERKSGYGCAAVLHTVTAALVQEVSVGLFRKIPRSKKKTVTFDRGVEFGGDDGWLEERTKMQIYRAHAYHSWERGTNENWNGLLRQFFPKGTNFATVTQRDVQKVVRNLNHRPRKRLHYLTPHEVFVLGLRPESAFHA